MCKEAKKDPTFKGQCLVNKSPTGDEYEDFFEENKSKISSTIRTNQDDTVNLALFLIKKYCPSGYRLNSRGKCKEVI